MFGASPLDHGDEMWFSKAALATADWIIDLGPGAEHGGRPDRLRGHAEGVGQRSADLTGQHLTRT